MQTENYICTCVGRDDLPVCMQACLQNTYRDIALSRLEHSFVKPLKPRNFGIFSKQFESL